MNYESVKIKDIENALKIGYITGFECDGDNKILVVKEDECQKLKEALKKVADTFSTIFNGMGDMLIKTFYGLNNILYKKITKKKIIKLLQSEGIQRNTINEIVKNNKEEYTYSRYYETLRRLENRRNR